MIPITNPYVLLGGVCGAALIFAAGFGVGHHAKTLEDASAALKSAKATVAVVAKQSAVVASVDQKAVQHIGQIQSNTASTLAKVKTYVSPQADAKCVVPNGYVSLLHDAASDPVPAASSSLPDADSGLDLSDLGAADTLNVGNYGTLQEIKATWERWYDGLNPDWKKAHPAP